MKNIVIISLLLLLICSCKNEQASSKLAQTIDQLQGKEIQFVHTDNYVVGGIDTIIHKDYKSYKVVVFADSVGCQTCNLKLGEWSVKIREMEFYSQDVDFVFIIQNSDYHQFEHEANEILPKHQFVYDSKGEFLSVNGLPKEARFHTFLLDKDNRIVIVGSPIGNDKLWALYKEQVKKDE